MLRTPFGWSAPRAAALALGLCMVMTRVGVAEPMLISEAATAAESTQTPLTTTDTTTTPDGQTSVTSRIQYYTSGTIGLTGVSGQNVISFQSIDADEPGMFTAPSAFSLGTFVVAPLPAGLSTTYDRTPFSITFGTQTVDGLFPEPNETPVTITGYLDGTVSGPRQSNVMAFFDPVVGNPFQTGSFLNSLSVLDNDLALVPSTTNGGRTTAQGRVVVTAAPGGGPAVPEPASIALLSTALVGLAVRGRLRRGRQGSA